MCAAVLGLNCICKLQHPCFQNLNLIWHATACVTQVVFLNNMHVMGKQYPVWLTNWALMSVQVHNDA